MKITIIILLICLSFIKVSGQKNEVSFRLGQTHAPVFDPGITTGIQYMKQLAGKWAVGIAVDYRTGKGVFEYYEQETLPVSRELMYSHKHKARVMNYDALLRYTALQNKAGTFKANITGGISWQRYTMRYFPTVTFQDFQITDKLSVQSSRGYIMPKLAAETQYAVSSRFFIAASVQARFLTGSSGLFSEELTSITSSRTIRVRNEYVNGHQLSFEIGAGFRF